jgi:hypothetical protein
MPLSCADDSSSLGAIGNIDNLLGRHPACGDNPVAPTQSAIPIAQSANCAC